MRVGIDILRVGELDRLIERAWFRRLIFADSELATAGAMAASRQREFLAGRFAAKEAVLKVLGRGYLQGIRPAEVEIVREGRGGPTVCLHGTARSAAVADGLGSVQVSLSHKDDLVVAVACAAGGDPTGGIHR